MGCVGQLTADQSNVRKYTGYKSFGTSATVMVLYSLSLSDAEALVLGLNFGLIDLNT